MEWLVNFYLGCFVFGLIFTVASFLLGGLDHLAAGQSSTLQSGTEQSSNEARQESLGWFNFNALVVFLTWFGGAGFILKSVRVNDWVSAGLAIISGVVGYLAVLLFMFKVVGSNQSANSRAADYDLTGTVALVSRTIFENGVGQVMYSKLGTRRVVAARSVRGAAFTPGSQVVILRFENGMAYVDDLDRLLTEAGAEKWATTSSHNPQPSSRKAANGD